jgi:hypothetical protein
MLRKITVLFTALLGFFWLTALPADMGRVSAPSAKDHCQGSQNSAARLPQIVLK